MSKQRTLFADAGTPEPPAKAVAKVTYGKTGRLLELQTAVDTFHVLYSEAYGTFPTWGPKQAAQMSRLVKSHGVVEVQTRMQRMFENPPDFLVRGGGAFDLNTFVYHFDKMAGPVDPDVSAEIAWGLVMRQAQRIGRNRAPAFTDNVTTEAVRCLGWETICNTDRPEILRHAFVRTYEAMVRRDRAKLIGGQVVLGKVATPALPGGEDGDGEG